MLNYLQHLWWWMQVVPVPFALEHFHVRSLNERYYTCMVCKAISPADDWINPETDEFEELN